MASDRQIAQIMVICTNKAILDVVITAPLTYMQAATSCIHEGITRMMTIICMKIAMMTPTCFSSNAPGTPRVEVDRGDENYLLAARRLDKG